MTVSQPRLHTDHAMPAPAARIEKARLRHVRRNAYAHHNYGPRLESNHALEERSPAQEESTCDAQGRIASHAILTQSETLKLKHPLPVRSR